MPIEFDIKAKSYILIYGPLLSLPLVHAIRMWNQGENLIKPPTKKRKNNMFGTSFRTGKKEEEEEEEGLCFRSEFPLRKYGGKKREGSIFGKVHRTDLKCFPSNGGGRVICNSKQCLYKKQVEEKEGGRGNSRGVCALRSIAFEIGVTSWP